MCPAFVAVKIPRGRKAKEVRRSVSSCLTYHGIIRGEDQPKMGNNRDILIQAVQLRPQSLVAQRDNASGIVGPSTPWGVGRKGKDTRT